MKQLPFVTVPLIMIAALAFIMAPIRPFAARVVIVLLLMISAFASIMAAIHRKPRLGKKAVQFPKHFYKQQKAEGYTITVSTGEQDGAMDVLCELDEALGDAAYAALGEYLNPPSEETKPDQDAKIMPCKVAGHLTSIDSQGKPVFDKISASWLQGKIRYELRWTDTDKWLIEGNDKLNLFPCTENRIKGYQDLLHWAIHQIVQ